MWQPTRIRPEYRIRARLRLSGHIAFPQPKSTKSNPKQSLGYCLGSDLARVYVQPLQRKCECHRTVQSWISVHLSKCSHTHSIGCPPRSSVPAKCSPHAQFHLKRYPTCVEVQVGGEAPGEGAARQTGQDKDLGTSLNKGATRRQLFHKVSSLAHCPVFFLFPATPRSQ